MIVNINDIKVKKRVRKDLGDIQALKESLQRYGLISPITINDKNELIAGERRLEAAKSLGWATISAQVVKTENKIQLLEMELEENNQRKEFTHDELMEGYKALEKLKNPSLFKKILNAIKEFFTCSQEKSAIQKQAKIKSSFYLAMLLPLGILLEVLTVVLYKTAVISSIVRLFIDLILVVVMAVGLIFLIRTIILKRNNRNK